MSLRKGSKLSIREQWAQQHIVRGVKEDWNRLVSLSPGLHDPSLLLDVNSPELPPVPFQKPHGIRYPPEKPIVIHLGIVGAGIAGLFTARVLDYLNWELFKAAIKNTGYTGVMPTTIDEFYRTVDLIRKPPNMLLFTYEVLESTDRVGGRLFTYDFGGPRETHDYYDVGAMRFPDNPVMARTFALFDKLGMKKTDLKKDPDAPDGSIIPYYIRNGDTESQRVEPWCFNDITLWGTYNTIMAASTGDPFEMTTDGTIPRDILKNPPDEVMNAAIKPFRDALRNDPDGREGWDLLMQYDTLSTRQFLGMEPPVKLPTGPIPPPPYNYETIQWMETFNGGTNWYDQANSETVLESMDFEYYDDKAVDWYCILGGAQKLAEILEKDIWLKPVYNSKVTKITAAGQMKVDVEVDTTAGKSTRRYNALINTTTLGCMSRMDLRDAGLNYATKRAIRSLGYGQSCKVAIKFKRAWWIHDLGDYSVRMGGLGHSDLNGRTCVYPSYNIYDDASGTAVLLCSYTWQQDADRIGALISSNDPDRDQDQKEADEAELKELLIRELVHLHKNDDMSDEALYKLISGHYEGHHAHDWGRDPNASGAFAFFRPQQFTRMWSRLIRPSGDVVVAGEAASPHHAWVVGALESAVHGLHAWMAQNADAVPELAAAAAVLERDDDPGNPFVGLPPYMTPTSSEWQGFLGHLHRSAFLDGTIEPALNAAARLLSVGKASVGI